MKVIDEGELLENIRQNVSREKKIVREMNSLFNHSRNSETKKEKDMISFQIKMLKRELVKSTDSVINSAERVSMV